MMEPHQERPYNAFADPPIDINLAPSASNPAKTLDGHNLIVNYKTH